MSHHFADVAQQRQQQFRKLPGAFAPRECESLHRLHFRIRGEITIILRFERRVCRWESCRMHQFMGMWLNPNSRGSRLRIWQPWGCKSLHAHHFTATGLSGNSRPRRLKIAEPSGCESRVADRRVVNREQQTGSTQDRTALGVQVSPRRPIWNANRTSEPGLGANECVPSGKWCKFTAFRHFLKEEVKRQNAETSQRSAREIILHSSFWLLHLFLRA